MHKRFSLVDVCIFFSSCSSFSLALCFSLIFLLACSLSLSFSLDYNTRQRESIHPICSCRCSTSILTCNKNTDTDIRSTSFSFYFFFCIIRWVQSRIIMLKLLHSIRIYQWCQHWWTPYRKCHRTSIDQIHGWIRVCNRFSTTILRKFYRFSLSLLFIILLNIL